MPALTLFPAPIHPACRLSVALPARDEADRIAACLGALACQQDLQGRPLDRTRYEVLVLVNNTSDGTAREALKAAARYPSFRVQVAEQTYPAERAHVGTARRAAMNAAADRLRSLGRPGGLIATTDADSRVRPRWVAETLKAARDGADLVAGRALADPDELAALPHAARRTYLEYVAYRELAAELEGRLDPHAGDPHPRHSQHHGASLAVTLKAYDAVGGLPPCPALEDLALHRALLVQGYRVRHAPGVRVTTSARSGCRTPSGLAFKLDQWARGGGLFVDSAASLLAQLDVRARLRAAWAHGATSPDRLGGLARTLKLPPQRLSSLLDADAPFETALDAIEREQEARHGAAWPLLVVGRTVRDSPEGWSARWPLVPAYTGVLGLRRVLARLREGRSVLRPFEQVEPVRVRPLAA